jgi:predicted ferric reductase
MSLASAPSFRNRLYEIFRIIHFGCSTSICILLWLHLLKAERLARIQAGLGLGVWAATYTHRNLLLVYRNFAFSKPRTSIWIENVHNNLVVHIRLARPWSVKPGQYVYLTMARSGFFSIFQRHPFMVASSELEGYDLALRIQPEAGFTRRLLRLCPRNRVKLEASASIEGPYGRGFDLRDYGTVVLLASGMGIVGQLPYIQELVQDYRCSKTKTRDLLLVWLVEDETQRDLVSEILDKTLRGDDLPTIQERHRKSDRPLGEGRTLARPGERPDPHGENASYTILHCYLLRR